MITEIMIMAVADTGINLLLLLFIYYYFIIHLAEVIVKGFKVLHT